MGENPVCKVDFIVLERKLVNTLSTTCFQNSFYWDKKIYIVLEKDKVARETDVNKINRQAYERIVSARFLTNNYKIISGSSRSEKF